MSFLNIKRFSCLLMLTSSLIACGGGDGDTDSSSNDATSSTNTVGLAVDVNNFKANALAEIATTESCTLSNGATSTCYRIVASGPSDQADLGPFCPPTTSSSAAAGGIWFDGNDVYDIDGAFILGLSELYNDNNWLLYDSAGNVNITDTQESCDAAARPNVAVEYQNHCVECEVSYISGGQPTATFLIPTTPVARTSVGSVTADAGVAFNGVTLNAPAPVDAILSAYTIAAFDDCAGHVNLVAGYHYHGANGCSEGAAQADGHAAAFGYALDGYAIYSMLDTAGNEPTDLDSCRGHSDDARGYHYHAASVAENMFIGCFTGEIAQ